MSDKFKITFVVVLWLTLTSCGEERNALRPLAKDAIILAFGDSLTSGTGASHENSYPSILEVMIKRKVVNAGVPGEVSRNGLKRLPGLLEKHQPSLLILIHGGNDMLRRRNIGRAVSNLREMISLAEDYGVDVVMLGVPNPGLILSPAKFYQTIADQTGTPIDADAISDILQYPSNKSDAVHPNARGYRMMAERIKELLEDEGAL